MAARRFAALAALALLLTLVLARAWPGVATAQVSSSSSGTSFGWSSGYSIVQHPIPVANAEPWSITVDSQGNVWFVEQGANQLGKYSPLAGNFTQYAIPTNRSTPDAIASDAHGNIWFAELTSNKLGELPSGDTTIAEFPIPGAVVNLGGLTQTLTCGPGAILADPSGVVWVACLFSNQIVEFNPANGTFASFDLPVFQSGPAGFALDGKGDLWFTAADSNMLGKAVISQLKNGTDSGITEFPPLNQTYQYRFTHPTDFLGATEVITSSLPTPSGIAVDPSGRLWVTEHVDNSFDSYDVASQSLVKYWTTQTYGAYGYPVSFPNGVAIDSSGSVWIGEHYGNRIAEFVPGSGVLTEYPVPCCTSNIAGVYSIALAPDGKLWFVEIGGNAIGEMVPLDNPRHLVLTLPQATFDLAPRGAVTIPLTYRLDSGNSTSLALSVSGVSGSGSLQNMTAEFGSPSLALAPGGEAKTNLTLSLLGLNPGVYYLTLGAKTEGGVIYSAILKLNVTEASSYPAWILVPAGVVAVVAGAAGWAIARRSMATRGRRRSLRISIRRTTTRAATPTPAAA